MALSKHDQKVKELAKRLERQGFNVKADIPGYEKPEGIGKKKYIPDLVAKKTNSTRIIEVETDSSAKKIKSNKRLSVVVQPRSMELRSRTRKLNKSKSQIVQLR